MASAHEATEFLSRMRDELPESLLALVRQPTEFGLGGSASAEAPWRTYAKLAGLPSHRRRHHE